MICKVLRGKSLQNVKGLSEHHMNNLPTMRRFYNKGYVRYLVDFGLMRVKLCFTRISVQLKCAQNQQQSLTMP